MGLLAAGDPACDPIFRLSEEKKKKKFVSGTVPKTLTLS
jgi:hypothetical protein